MAAEQELVGICEEVQEEVRTEESELRRKTHPNEAVPTTSIVM